MTSKHFCRVLLGLAFLAFSHPGARADDGAPSLTEQQQAKLKKIQAMFLPGGKVNSMGHGIDTSEEFCGARIPLEIHPSTVALEKMDGDRTTIDSTCNAFAGAVVYTCGTNNNDADPVVKEMIRTSIKRMVCRATSDREATSRGPGNSNYGVKYTLEDGTLTLLYAPSPSSIQEVGEQFLKENVRQGPGGLSIGGQRLKRKMVESMKLENSDMLRTIKEKCGIELADIAIDDKLMEHFSHRMGLNSLSMCDSGLQVIYNNCSSDGTRDREITSPVVKEALKKNLKGLSCVYAESQTVAIKPNGVLEFGYSADATHPGRANSADEYIFNWMKANIGSLGSNHPPAAGTKPAEPAKAEKPRAKPKPGKRRH